MRIISRCVESYWLQGYQLQGQAKVARFDLQRMSYDLKVYTVDISLYMLNMGCRDKKKSTEIDVNDYQVHLGGKKSWHGGCLEVIDLKAVSIVISIVNCVTSPWIHIG